MGTIVNRPLLLQTEYAVSLTVLTRDSDHTNTNLNACHVPNTNDGKKGAYSAMALAM